jgi:hypothetical protein
MLAHLHAPNFRQHCCRSFDADFIVCNVERIATTSFFLETRSVRLLARAALVEVRDQAFARFAKGCAWASRWMVRSQGCPSSSSQSGSEYLTRLNCFFSAIALGFWPAATWRFHSASAQFQTRRAVPAARAK